MSQFDIAAHNASVNASFAKLPSGPSGRKSAIARVNPCECGCAAKTGRRFAIGHDAMLHSRAKKVARGLVTLDWIAANMVPGDAAQSMNIATATAKFLGIVYPEVVAAPVKKARKAKAAK